jgi:N-succinyldiaminopimelate aminotransferase
MKPAVQAASIAAWNDEAHVIENRRQYAEKFKDVTPLLSDLLEATIPDAAFYLWSRIKSDKYSDSELAVKLYRDLNITVLPGSFLAREAHGVNPGKNFVRMALVASYDECIEAAHRIREHLHL